MTWQTWFCPDVSCTDQSWMVRRDPALCDLWWVVKHTYDRPFMIAATAPVCPLCGTTLLAPIESFIVR